MRLDAVGALLTLIASPLIAYGSPQAAPVDGCPTDSLDHTLCFKPSTARAGQTVHVQVTNFVSCTGEVVITMDAKSVVLVGEPTRTKSSVDADFIVPGALAAGAYEVEVVCDNIFAFTDLTVEPAPPPVAAVIQLQPASTSPGKNVTVTGSGFGRCRTKLDFSQVRISLTVGTTKKPLAATAIGEGGGFSTSIVVPSELTKGTYPVVAECGNSAGTGAAASADLTVAGVVPPPPTISPPTFGPDPRPPPATYDPPPTYTGSVPNPPQIPSNPPTPNPGKDVGAALGGLLAVVLAVVLAGLAVPLMRRLRPRPATPAQPIQTPALDAVLVGCDGQPPRLRETGSSHTVAVRVVAHRDPGTQTVRWFEEGGPR